MMNGVVDKLCFNISIRNLICFGLAFFARCVGEYKVIQNSFAFFIWLGKLKLQMI